MLFGVAQAQTDNELGLHSEGGPWSFFSSETYNEALPNVLLIGNSVMNGYKNTVIPALKEKSNVDYWLTPKHLNSEFLFEDLAKVVSMRNYAVIHFNIGLHGWPEGRIGENEYQPLLERYVETIKENAKDSRLIWASTTPVTETEKPELNKEINPTISKRNTIAEVVMKKYDVEVNDLYGLVVDKLQLAKGDRFHWKAEGYELMGNQSVEAILAALRRKQILRLIRL